MYNFPISPAAGTLYAPPEGPTWRFLDGAWQQETEVDPPLIGAVYFDSVAQAAASTISGSLNAIHVTGYYAAGDGGGALYKRVGVAPTHAGKIHSADGAWWELAEIAPNCLMFGAKRDGVTDDAPAINAMLAYLPMAGGGSLDRTTEAVIPLGHYKIGSTITCNKTTLRLVGKGAYFSPHASFALAGFAMDLFLWDGSVEGITFDGFDYGLYVQNENTDQGLITLKDLFFKGGLEAMRVRAQSTKTVIDGVKCVGSVMALNVIAGDLVEWRSGWIKQGVLTANYSATIDAAGFFEMGPVILVPAINTGTGTAWINCRYGVKLHRVRFGGESGSGTIVNNFSEGDAVAPFVPRGILIDSCSVYTLQPAIRCMKLPNYINVVECEGFSGNSYVVTFDASLTTLAAELTRMIGGFSIKLDNIPEGDSMTIDTVMANGFDLMPYLVLPGFSVGRSATVNSTTGDPIKFFGGKDSTTHFPFRGNSAYLIEVSQDTSAGGDTYSSFHVKATFPGGAAAPGVVTVVKAPTITSAGVVYFDTDNILKIKANGGASSRFFYKISKIGSFGIHGGG